MGIDTNTPPPTEHTQRSDTPRRTMSRRRFLGGVAAVGGAATLAALANGNLSNSQEAAPQPPESERARGMRLVTERLKTFFTHESNQGMVTVMENMRENDPRFAVRTDGDDREYFVDIDGDNNPNPDISLTMNDRYTRLSVELTPDSRLTTFNPDERTTIPTNDIPDVIEEALLEEQRPRQNCS